MSPKPEDWPGVIGAEEAGRVCMASLAPMLSFAKVVVSSRRQVLDDIACFLTFSILKAMPFSGMRGLLLVLAMGTSYLSLLAVEPLDPRDGDWAIISLARSNCRTRPVLNVSLSAY